jgi:hypothetical protein
MRSIHRRNTVGIAIQSEEILATNEVRQRAFCGNDLVVRVVQERSQESALKQGPESRGKTKSLKGGRKPDLSCEGKSGRAVQDIA